MINYSDGNVGMQLAVNNCTLKVISGRKFRGEELVKIQLLLYRLIGFTNTPFSLNALGIDKTWLVAIRGNGRLSLGLF
jgi:hypothetical protein